MTKTIGDGDRTDFDETRRVAYMGILASKTKHYELAATLVNALVHHHAVDGLDADEAARMIIKAIKGKPSGQRWLRKQIDRINGQLGG